MQARSGEPFAQEATQLVKNLMKCDYSSLRKQSDESDSWKTCFNPKLLYRRVH